MELRLSAPLVVATAVSTAMLLAAGALCAQELRPAKVLSAEERTTLKTIARESPEEAMAMVRESFKLKPEDKPWTDEVHVLLKNSRPTAEVGQLFVALGHDEADGGDVKGAIRAFKSAVASCSVAKCPPGVEASALQEMARLQARSGLVEPAIESFKLAAEKNRRSTDSITGVVVLLDHEKRSSDIVRFCTDLAGTRRANQALACARAAAQSKNVDSGTVDDLIVSGLSVSATLAPEELRPIIAGRQGLDTLRDAVERCESGDVLDGAMPPSMGALHLPGKTTSILARLAEGATDPRKRSCYVLMTAESCLAALGDGQACSEPMSLAAHVEDLAARGEDGELATFLASIYQRKTMLYDDLRQGNREAAEPIAHLHLALAHAYAGSVREGRHPWETFNYHVCRFRRTWQTYNPDLPVPEGLEPERARSLSAADCRRVH